MREIVPEKLRTSTERLAELLSTVGAARVGDTSCVSTKVHVQDVRIPHEITAIQDNDAGQVFYNRDSPGEIIHIDTFHSIGIVDPLLLAQHLKVALVESTEYLPYVDIQTAAGGGRVDGSLEFGREEGVRRAHLTHVHITMLNAPELVQHIFAIIAATEATIEASGLELRKIRSLKLAKASGTMDPSDYLATSDSLLKKVPPSRAGTSAAQGEALAREAAMISGSAESALRLLKELSRGLRPGELERYCPGEKALSLVKSELGHFDGSKFRLTKQGEVALEYLYWHQPEVNAYVRRLLYKLPSGGFSGRLRKGKSLKAAASSRGLVLEKQTAVPGAPVAVPESTIRYLIRRTCSPEDSGTPSVSPDDLMFLYSHDRRTRPVILLIDASASMAGKRIAAAKELARHLVVASKERVSVVVFQDSSVETVCEFTRSLKTLEKNIKVVQAQGLTPLALGLEKAVEISRSCVRKPLVLCITDGIPTVPSRTLSAIDDALEAAREIARHHIKFGCIGLEPNKGFLQELVTLAKGNLYIVQDLEASHMAAIARRERLK